MRHICSTRQAAQKRGKAALHVVPVVMLCVRPTLRYGDITSHTTHNTQHTTHNTQHTTQHTTHNTQHTTPHTYGDILPALRFGAGAAVVERKNEVVVGAQAVGTGPPLLPCCPSRYITTPSLGHKAMGGQQ
jgi:hypothetical protein